MIKEPVAAKNNPEKAGKKASKAVYFGSNGRYAVRAVHTRFESVQWFVTDAEKTDEQGFATVIRQENNFSDAIIGLE
jgi:hypothetical protein